MLPKLMRALFVSSVCLSMWTCGALQAADIPAKDRMVIVISLDGFAAYNFDDPQLPTPTLRSLMQSGSWAKSMRPVNPTWTWPNHTSMVTGVPSAEHGVLYNGTLIRSENPLSTKIDPTRPKTEMVKVPTLYDIAQQAGLTTAQVDWVAINDASAITWAFPEMAKPSDPLVKEMVAKGILQEDDVRSRGHFSVLWRDQDYTKAGAYLIREHKPNLLLFHLLALDSAQHTYGPKTLAAYSAIAFLDSCVAQLVAAVREAGMWDRTTFVVVSDHGFSGVKRQILLKNWFAAEHWEAVATAVPEGGCAMVYLDKSRKSELLPKIKAAFAKTEGVDSMIDESQFPAMGFPLPANNEQMPDLIVYPKPGYGFAAGKGDGPVVADTTPVGSHGYPNTDQEMQAIFIASGYGIRQGEALPQISNLNLAPTLAKLLGVKLPLAKSPAITDILK